MKITIYELLGLIKDGKAPKKIIYNNRVWEYIEIHRDYYNEMWSLLENQIDVITNYFDEVVEILDKEDEFIDIEEITQECFDNWTCAKHINQLIKNQKKIINKLKEEGK